MGRKFFIGFLLLVPCVVYVLDGDRWLQDEAATDFFHENIINY